MRGRYGLRGRRNFGDARVMAGPFSNKGSRIREAS